MKLLDLVKPGKASDAGTKVFYFGGIFDLNNASNDFYQNKGGLWLQYFL